jgi:GT2 family glycosyltransferase
MDYSFFEMIILPDSDFVIKQDARIRVVPTGNVLPAEKRDIGAAQARGQILAFLDDDAYPNKDWLNHAVKHFEDHNIACVCGPAITPAHERLLNKASGRVYESIMVSGPARFRYVPLKKRFTDDFPSCNFLIRREVFEKIGGFNTKFWPGEDTILCLEVVHNLKKKIIYDPLVLVHHYRRPLFIKHLYQVASYAKHRGYFLKRYPKTSLKIGYFGPTVIVLALIVSLALGLALDSKFFIVPLFYLAIVIISSLCLDIRLIFLVFVGTVLTHLTYGINFVLGLLSPKLKEE